MPKDIPIIRKFRILIEIHVRGSKIGDPNKQFSQLNMLNHLTTLHQRYHQPVHFQAWSTDAVSGLPLALHFHRPSG